MTLPTITAIVVTYHTGPRLHECLYGLKSDPDISEIVIVDNGNPPAEQAWIDRFTDACDKAHIVRDGTNPGFGTAVNKGAAGALGELLLVINPDAVLRRGSLGHMVRAMGDTTEPVLVGGKIFDIHGREERGGRRKRFFEITHDGKAALAARRQMREQLWGLMPDWSLQGGTS